MKELESSYFQANLNHDTWPWKCLCCLKFCDTDEAGDTAMDPVEDPVEEPDEDDSVDMGQFDPTEPMPDVPDEEDAFEPTDQPPTNGDGDTGMPDSGDPGPTDDPVPVTFPPVPPVKFPARPQNQVYTGGKPPKKKKPSDAGTDEPTESTLAEDPDSLWNTLEDIDIEVTDFPSPVLIDETPDPLVFESPTTNPNNIPLDDNGNEDYSNCTTQYNDLPIERPEIKTNNDALGNHLDEMNAVTNKINAYRQANGVDPLQIDWRYVQQAQDQCNWVANNLPKSDEVVSHQLNGYTIGGIAASHWTDRALLSPQLPDDAIELVVLSKFSDAVDTWLNSPFGHPDWLKSPQYKKMGFSWKSTIGYAGANGGVGFLWMSKDSTPTPEREQPDMGDPEDFSARETAHEIVSHKHVSPFKCADNPDGPDELVYDSNAKLPEAWYENLSIDDMASIDEVLRDSYDPVQYYESPAGPGTVFEPDSQPHLSKNSSVWPNPREMPIPSISTVYKYDNTTCGKYIDMYGGTAPTTSSSWIYKDSNPTPYEDVRIGETTTERRHRLAKEQQFLALLDNKYGNLKTPPTLPVWVNIDKWNDARVAQDRVETEEEVLYADFGKLIYELAYTLDMSEVKDPYGVPFDRPQDFIVFNYWLYHRQQFGVESIPVVNGEIDFGAIPGERMNFQPNTGEHWDYVDDFALTNADFPFPPGILDDDSPRRVLEQMWLIDSELIDERQGNTQETVYFKGSDFASYSFNNDFPYNGSLERIPTEEFFTFYAYHPYEYLYEFAKAYAARWGASVLAYTLELFNVYHELSGRSFEFPVDFPALNLKNRLPIQIDDVIAEYMNSHILDPMYETERSMKLYLGMAYYSLMSRLPLKGTDLIGPGTFPRLRLVAPEATHEGTYTRSCGTEFYTTDGSFPPYIPADIDFQTNMRSVLFYQEKLNNLSIARTQFGGNQDTGTKFLFLTWMFRNRPADRSMHDHLIGDVTSYSEAFSAVMPLTYSRPNAFTGATPFIWDDRRPFFEWRVRVKRGVEGFDTLLPDDLFDTWTPGTPIVMADYPNPVGHVETMSTHITGPVSASYYTKFPVPGDLDDTNLIPGEPITMMDYVYNWMYKDFDIDLQNASTPEEAASLLTVSDLHSEPFHSVWDASDTLKLLTWYMTKRKHPDMYRMCPGEVNLTLPDTKTTVDDYMKTLRRLNNAEWDYFFGAADPEVSNEMVYFSHAYSKLPLEFPDLTAIDETDLTDSKFDSHVNHTSKLSKYFHQRSLLVAEAKKLSEEPQTSAGVINDNADPTFMVELQNAKHWVCNDPNMGEFILWLNGERLKLSREPLIYHAHLTACAQRHAEDMLYRDYLSVEAIEPSPHGVTTQQRKVASYWMNTAVSNAAVAKGWTLQECIDFLIADVAQFEILMSPEFKYAGLGYQYTPPYSESKFCVSLAGPVVNIAIEGRKYLDVPEMPPYCSTETDEFLRTLYPEPPYLKPKSSKAGEGDVAPYFYGGDQTINGIIRVTSKRDCNKCLHDSLLYPYKDTILIRFKAYEKVTMSATCHTNREYQMEEGSDFGKFQTYNKGPNATKIASARIAVRGNPGLASATKIRTPTTKTPGH
ncbi:unknown protein [Seminavis robusta]|uniref:SCP domain-containing protein n=1 Tax=Seminavis robusta TaxID=568900 RepID=A0A9N8HEQ6_9STRA|nr:unknown protein [Seminavis robusta]|eukprot:Sro485_g152500.1 n/a (1592) ;mRNA; f:54667-59442